MTGETRSERRDTANAAPDVREVLKPGLPTLSSLDAAELEELDRADAVRAEPYRKERLFSRKVLAGWAAATLIVWFALSFIAPIVIESIKTAIISATLQSAPTTPAPTSVDPEPVVAPVPANPLEAPSTPVPPPSQNPSKK